MGACVCVKWKFLCCRRLVLFITKLFLFKLFTKWRHKLFFFHFTNLFCVESSREFKSSIHPAETAVEILLHFRLVLCMSHFFCECEFIAYIKHRLVMYEDPNEIHQPLLEKKGTSRRRRIRRRRRGKWISVWVWDFACRAWWWWWWRVHGMRDRLYV